MDRCSIIREVDSLEQMAAGGGSLSCAVIQGLDLSELQLNWEKTNVDRAVFLGCTFPSIEIERDVIHRGAYLFPRFSRLPYDPYRPGLYSVEELTEGWSRNRDESVDRKIYDHFMEHGRGCPDIMEALAQRLHDHAIDDALHDLLTGRLESDHIPKKVIAIMGGHGTLRTDPYFEKVAVIARELTRRGYLLASGGGPGMMEATNFGAYLAEESGVDFLAALDCLKKAPHFESPGYMECAMEVVKRYPGGCDSLAIPTWFYGHEPSNLFSRHIAKYFSNSIREDGLLAIARHGVIYSPGSAGTVQEVFMDATQNHYATFDYVSPMAFLGRDHYGDRTGIFDVVKRQAAGKGYSDLIALFEDTSELINFICTYTLTKPEPAAP